MELLFRVSAQSVDVASDANINLQAQAKTVNAFIALNQDVRLETSE